MLRAAMAKTEAARDHFQRVKRRNGLIRDFVRGTFGYVNAKKDAAQQGALLQWTLEQIFLIEEEMAQSKVIEAGSSAAKSTKRSLTPDMDHLTKQKSKRQKLHKELDWHSSSNEGILAKDTVVPDPGVVTDQGPVGGSQSNVGVRRSLRSVDDSGATSQGPRRSTRFTKYQNTSEMAPAPDNAQQELRSRSCPRPAEPSRPPSSAEDTKSTRRGAKINNQQGAAKPKGVSKTRRRRRPVNKRG
ncbi:uncharacterized protein F5Z01DRAFT_748356 [Emericellopsis atlantica]|uniref:Uncharacterized protein n=1 Tax=Emericellopsis atlantica TaxID=2614577 RepID=A0A9P7ZR89_9HYPO|nr:uncharacterized protein F5Z01DRAFT_748356 [Emericellopsis atlantica]KAG9256750.1 hypothetical protein F5Z01DRAFT_748356 [Emericellopsis atlantica]